MCCLFNRTLVFIRVRWHWSCLCLYANTVVMKYFNEESSNSIEYWMGAMRIVFKSYNLDNNALLWPKLIYLLIIANTATNTSSKKKKKRHFNQTQKNKRRCRSFYMTRWVIKTSIFDTVKENIKHKAVCFPHTSGIQNRESIGTWNKICTEKVDKTETTKECCIFSLQLNSLRTSLK